MVDKLEVVAGIIINDGHILCCQRGLRTHLPKVWEFPGGKIEAGETKQAALQRELREELCVDVQIEQEEFATTRYTYDFGCVYLTTFFCQLTSGEPKLTEHLQLKWLLPSELEQLNWAPANKLIIDKLKMREFK